jgi:hypothetical protein
MKDVAIKAARWMLEKYAPEYHVHKSPTRKERPRVPGVLNMTREQYMALRRTNSAPDPRDYEDPAEVEHEREKWVMKMEAQREGDR